MTRVLAIDIGTTRLKVASVDEVGSIIKMISKKLPRAESPSEQNALVWWQCTLDLIKELIASGENEFACIGLTGNMHALLPLGEDGKPLMPAKLWSDFSAEKESNYLNDTYADVLLQRFYNLSIPGFPLPKLLKLHHEQPELMNKIWMLLQPKDYIGYCLTGIAATDCSDASGTLMYNMQRKSWDNDFLQNEGLNSSILPPVHESSHIIGNVTAEVAAEIGLKQGIPVIAGAGDLATAALGSAVDKNTMSLTLGTAGQMMAIGQEDPETLKGKIFIFSYAEADTNLFLGSVPAGGFSFEWLSKLYNISLDEFFSLADRAEFAKNYPVYLPFILGSGAPYMDYTPKGGFIDLSAENEVPELCLAAIAGVLSSLKHSHSIIESIEGERARLVVQALAVREHAVRNTVNQLFDKEVCSTAESEASLVGAAILAMVGAGVYHSISDAQQAMVKCNPLQEAKNPEVANYLQHYYEKYVDAANKCYGTK